MFLLFSQVYFTSRLVILYRLVIYLLSYRHFAFLASRACWRITATSRQVAGYAHKAMHSSFHRENYGEGLSGSAAFLVEQAQLRQGGTRLKRIIFHFQDRWFFFFYCIINLAARRTLLKTHTAPGDPSQSFCMCRKIILVLVLGDSFKDFNPPPHNDSTGKRVHIYVFMVCCW